MSRLAPRPPITYARPPSAAAAACVVGPGRRPSRRSTPLDRRVLEHPGARFPVRQRPACDDELAAGRGDGRVAHGRGQMVDDPRAPAGRPRDDGVEPVRPGETADDVRRAADRGGGLVRARGRQPAGDASADPNDLVVLPRAVASAEQIHRSAQPRRSRVVHSGRQAAGCAVAGVRDHVHGVGRRVGSGQPSEQHRAGAVQRDGGRILERRVEAARGPRGQGSRHHRVRPGSNRFYRHRVDGGPVVIAPMATQDDRPGHERADERGSDEGRPSARGALDGPLGDPHDLPRTCLNGA